MNRKLLQKALRVVLDREPVKEDVEKFVECYGDLAEANASRRMAVICTVAGGIILLIVYVVACAIAMSGAAHDPPLPTELVQSLSPSHHPWITFVMVLILALIGLFFLAVHTNHIAEVSKR